MNWTRLFNRLRGGPATQAQDLDDEIAFHSEMKQRALRAEGMTEEEALLIARRSMGNLTMAREEAHEAWTFPWLNDLARDLQYGVRMLRIQPAFTIAAVLALVLGIGVNAILFNVYNALALAPWAIRDASQMAEVYADRGRGRWNGFSWPEYRYMRANTQTLTGMTASTPTGIRITRGETTWNGMAITVSDNFFDLLGTGFTAGRGFSPETNRRDPSPEIVLQHEAWMTRFGGDRNVVGEWLDLNGHRLQVVGIAAPGFSGPSPTAPQLWITGPWRDKFHPNLNSIENPNNCCVSVIGRLKPGLDRAAAQAELNTLSAQFLASVKREPTRILLTRPTMMANPTMSGRASGAFLAVGVASLLILLLACANVANLQLARAAVRRREIAVRLSLGAGRGRILRQLLVESVLLSAIAGAVTVWISGWAPKRIISSIVDANDNLSFQFSNDGRVLAFILFMTFAAAVLFGFAPAWGAVRDAVASGLREGGRTTSTGRMRGILLGAQVALCTVLLSGATLLVRALDQAQRLDIGFRYENVVLMSPNLDSSGVNDEQARGLLAPLVERIGQLPGVESVAHATVVPLGNSFDSTSIPDPRTKDRVSIGYNQVSASFFDTLAIPLLSGRPFTAADEAKPDAVIVTEGLAQRLWPGESPLGKSLGVQGPREVIGVVRNFSTRQIGPMQELHAYIPSKGTRGSRLLIRHSGAAAPLIADLPRLARQLDRRLLAAAAPYKENVDRARRTAVISASIAGVLSSLALMLACVGIYGVAACTVSQRTREIGVRMALGARPRVIQSMILRQNLRTVLAGAVLGAAGAIAVTQLLTSMLFGVKPGDPPAMLAALGILFATAALATIAPARRASAVDPAITLRHE